MSDLTKTPARPGKEFTVWVGTAGPGGERSVQVARVFLVVISIDEALRRLTPPALHRDPGDPNASVLRHAPLSRQVPRGRVPGAPRAAVATATIDARSGEG